MSKSNNQHCTPDVFGEQKGEFSPFFHIMNKKELKNILLDISHESTYISEKDLEEFSTFFHEERRARFLSDAQKASSMRQALAKEINGYIHQLSNALSELAARLSKPLKAKGNPLTDCAALSVSVSEKESKIRTNILTNISKTLIFLHSDNTFFHFQKGLFFMETAMKFFQAYPPDWESTKASLTQYPPQELISILSHAIQHYEKAESLLASQLLLAAKAAKAQNHEKYVNILHETAVHLYDTAGLLKAIRTEV